MSAAPATRWWWLRHAPVPDPEGRISGRLDLPCDTSDTEWFARLAERLPRNAVLVESGLIRCGQTIGALEAAGLPLPPPVIDGDLIEQHFGRWQGHGWDELAAAADPDLAGFWHNPATAPPPGGESFAAMLERVRGALAMALDITAESAICFAIDPLSLTRIDGVPGGWRVVGVNWPPA